MSEHDSQETKDLILGEHGLMLNTVMSIQAVLKHVEQDNWSEAAVAMSETIQLLDGVGQLLTTEAITHDGVEKLIATSNARKWDRENRN